MGFDEGMVQAGVIPGRLVTLARQTYETVENFEVLQPHSVVDFRNSLNEDLAAKGWPIPKDLWEKNVIPVGFLDSIMLLPGWMVSKPSGLQWRRLIQQRVDALEDGIKPFFVEEQRLAELEASLRKATDETQKKFGDPATVKRNQRSLPRAIFNAVAAKFTKKTPETKLAKDMKKINAISKAATKNGISTVEAGKRAGQMLEDRQWPINKGDAESQALNGMIRSLALAAQKKTTIGMRYELQDENFPPRPNQKAAKDFLLAHAGEFSDALHEAVTQLKAEKAAGLKPAPKP